MNSSIKLDSYDVISQFTLKFLPPKYANLITHKKYSKKYSDHLKLVVDTLEKLAEEFKIFCEKNQHKQKFTDIVNSLNLNHLEEARYHFETISDELFKEGIRWAHIVTYLVLCAELASLAQDKVGHVVDMAVTYLDTHIIGWIETPSFGGWIGVLDLLVDDKIDTDEIDTNGIDTNENKSLKKYYGYAALAAVVGLFICARFGLQTSL